MKRYSALAGFLVLTVLLILAYSFNRKVNPGLKAETLEIESGLISGVKSVSSEVIAYKGIPFAEKM